MPTLAEFDLPTTEKVISGLKACSPNSFEYGEKELILKSGSDSEVYGPFFKRLAQYGLRQVKQGTMDPEQLTEALLCAAPCYRFADVDYRKNKGALTGTALAEHQANVLAGIIKPVPNEAATSVKQGQAMARTADYYIGDHDPHIQAVLAEINYGSTFTPKTMAGAQLTQERSNIETLLSTIGKNPEAMPHVTLTNWVIGEIAAGIYQAAARLRPPQRLRYFDLGSGSGGTAAATTACLANVVNIPRKPPLAYTAIETTLELYDELRTFSREDEAIKTLDLHSFPYNPKGKLSISEFGMFTSVKADVLSSLNSFLTRNIERTADRIADYDTLIVTVNYAGHRFGTRKWEGIIELFRYVPNVIFLICDLFENISAINRLFFNLSANGPLNPGNINLETSFKHKGFNIIDLDKEQPASLDRRLAERLRWTSEHDDQGLVIACKGRLALDALNLVPVTY